MNLIWGPSSFRRPHASKGARYVPLMPLDLVPLLGAILCVCVCVGGGAEVRFGPQLKWAPAGLPPAGVPQPLRSRVAPFPLAYAPV